MATSWRWRRCSATWPAYDVERAVREMEESGHPAASEIAGIYRSGRPSSKPLGA